MRTHDPKINQLSPEAFEWYLAYLAAIEAKDIDLHDGFLADDCVSQTNIGLPIHGKVSILDGLPSYRTAFEGFTHDLPNLNGTGSSFVLDALSQYERRDGAAVMLRSRAFTDRDEVDLAKFVRPYANTTPLFAPAG